jgi:hypothetical protein
MAHAQQSVSGSLDCTRPRSGRSTVILINAYHFAKLIGCRRRFKVDEALLNEHLTDTQHTAMLRRSTVLRSKLRAFQEAQQLYCPGAVALRLEAAAKLPDGCPPPPVHSICLWLPLDIGRKKLCDSRLQKYKWTLRYLQASDASDTLRQNLHYLSLVYKHKNHFSRSQDTNTCSNGLISSICNKSSLIASCYHQARLCLEALAPILGKNEGKEYEWTQRLQVLELKDVRVMSASDVSGDGHSKGAGSYRGYGW